jgi:hypothetical protein
MSRTYSDPTYGSRHTLVMSGNVGLHTAAALANALALRVMYPCKVTTCALTFPGGLAGDLGTSTSATLNRSTDSGTGLIAFGTCDFYSELATCTFAGGEVVDYTITETTFNAGDDIILAIEGTVGEVFTDVNFAFEAIEVFQQADS